MDDSNSVLDAMAIAGAFRAANDEDTMQVMNTQASKKSSDLARLRFYAVPASWMRKAWPFLTAAATGQPHETGIPGVNWREYIGRIECNDLLMGENAVSSDEEEEAKATDAALNTTTPFTYAAAASSTKAAVPQQSRKEVLLAEATQRAVRESKQQRRKVALRRDLTHEKDFFLLGANAWLLVKEKFGYDHEIEKRCTLDQNLLAVVLHEKESVVTTAPSGSSPLVPQHLPAVYISIPLTGRFRYELHFNANRNRMLQNPNSGINPGNVSDDDTAPAYADDLFPALGDDDRMSTDQPEGSEQPILLLPPPDPLDGSNNDCSWLSDRQSAVDEDMDESKMDADSDAMESKSVELRRYGSGLGNLGNTCFMNCSLQCLAHTTPLQQYFLSNDYENDLNRENPLGTGGELATQFASLMTEMWGTAPSQRRSVFPSSSAYSADTSSVVYPRNFKYTLGKHAEQFVGYDQHDSQELATYLLDALHEDTNRVTKKPYVEKPEQGEDESDEEAAKKAWQLHLQREDSKVLENFMGQIKSRVQCCEEGCGRVSTTFDPFMYLSVPIPGSLERTLEVTFVPLDPNKRAKTVSVTLSKTALISELLRKVKGQLEKFAVVSQGSSLVLEDLCAVDVWQNEVYEWYEEKQDLDRIRDNDETFIYQLRPLAEVKAIAADIGKYVDDEAEASILGLRSSSRSRRYQIDVGTLTRLNRESEWTNEMSNYLRNRLGLVNAFNLKKGSTKERVAFYQRLVNFIELCQQEADTEVDVAGQKRTREDKSDVLMTSPAEEEIPELISRSDSSQYFKNVKTRFDVAVLEFLASKMRLEIMRMENGKKQAHPNGVNLQVRLKKTGTVAMAKDQDLAAPFVLRIPPDMTVYALRQEIARRLTRSLKTGLNTVTPSSSGQPTTENQTIPKSDDTGGVESKLNAQNGFGSPDLLLIRQIPLSYERKSGTSYKSYSVNSQQLGSIEKRGSQTYDSSRPISLASATDEDEKGLVADLVGNEGTVFLDWPIELCDRSFDLNEYETVDDVNSLDGDEAIAKRTRASSTTTVLDCIEKYCAMEQLEETEMWYCNRCKKHVRAWKQFHLFRSPPILIVHLKRFQYSALTHRRDKIGIPIDFPLEGLDLTGQAMHWTEEEKPIYDCYAVSNHYGGLGGGHYTAYALNNDGVWCHYDDSRVTSHVDAKEVVSDAAYVLYYRRRDVPTGQDFLAQIQTSALPPPAIIRDNMDKPTDASEVSSSNAAMIDEDEAMEVDVTDVGSRSTSPMGSIGDMHEPLGDHDFDTTGDGRTFPLQ